MVIKSKYTIIQILIGRPTTFETGSRRAVGYLMEVAGDKPIDLHSRSDANAFRGYLKARGLSQESISRNLTSVRAIINFVSKEEGLQPHIKAIWLLVIEANWVICRTFGFLQVPSLAEKI